MRKGARGKREGGKEGRKEREERKEGRKKGKKEGRKGDWKESRHLGELGELPLPRCVCAPQHPHPQRLALACSRPLTSFIDWLAMKLHRGHGDGDCPGDSHLFSRLTLNVL